MTAWKTPEVKGRSRPSRFPPSACRVPGNHNVAPVRTTLAIFAAGLSLTTVTWGQGRVDVKVTPATREYCHIIRFPQGWKLPMFVPGLSYNQPIFYRNDSSSDYGLWARERDSQNRHSLKLAQMCRQLRPLHLFSTPLPLFRKSSAANCAENEFRTSR